MIRTRTIQGELLTVAAKLKREETKVDLVMCSPPYEDARLYGELGFKVRGQDWVDWAVPRFMACLERCNGLVVWVIEGKTRKYRWSATPALLMADLHRRGVCLRKPPAFKRVGVPGSGSFDWLRNDYEFLVCATNGGRLPWSDNTAMGHPPKWAPGGAMANRLTNGTRVNQWGKTVGDGQPTSKARKADGTRDTRKRPSHRVLKVCGNSRRSNGETARGGYDMPSIANPGNVIECLVGGGVMGSRLAHENEAPFPEKLAEFVIRSFCPPGGRVWDPFSGSGTTAAVALRHGRNAIASDIRASQIDLTVRRIAEVRAELSRRSA